MIAIYKLGVEHCQFSVCNPQFAICNQRRWLLGLFFVAAALPLSVTFAQSLQPAVWPAVRPLPTQKLQRLGLRVIEGDHLTLVTDVPPSAEIEELPKVAAAALPLLAEYFGIAAEELDGWRVQACLIADRSKFDAAGLMPPMPHDAFPHALSMGYELWVNEQPSVYYTRALLLHELTHSLMSTRLGGCGPGWYMEAVAELMGAHAWNAAADKLRLRDMPADKTDVPFWGRVPLVRKAPAPLTIDAVMRIDNNRSLEVDAYAAVWSLAKFMDTHPRYRDRFRKLPRIVLRQDFNDRFHRGFAKDWEMLSAEYQLFAATLEYGHDIEREAIAFREGEPLGDNPRVADIRADRGWQPAGVAVTAGETYRYTAEGRFVIARDPDGTPWPCEANGITITYHAGRPLGQLLGVVEQLGGKAGAGGFLESFPLDTSGQFTAPATGALYLRVNDRPNQLAENEGRLQVTLRHAVPQ